MYTYSPIKTIFVKNFRNIDEVTLDFSESPIIALIGENEAGKTSIVKAFGVCALHANARDQKDYIRDGTNGFGVAIELENSALITRMKTPTLNKYSVKKADGELWDTNKIDAGLPIQVSELMGLIQEPETKEFLQIRTYEDQLLFVVTPASTNYKVMYDALKVDQLTRAIKVGSNESNELKATIGDNNTSIRTLTENLRGIKIYDLEALINVRNRINSQVTILDKLEKAKSILDRINLAKQQLGALNMLDEYNLKPIDLVEVAKLITANRLLDSSSNLTKLLQLNEKASSAEFIDLAIINKLRDAIEKRDRLETKIKSAGALESLSKLREISEYEAKQINRVMALQVQMKASAKVLATIDVPGCELVEQRDFDIVFKLERMRLIVERNNLLKTEEDKSNTVVKQIEDYLKQCGAAVAMCTKCGESIVLDLEQLTA